MLTGDLSDFSLRNVLEFLSVARKSGLLTIRCASVDGGVFLRDGDVCLGLVDVTRVPLGPRLIARGLVDRAALREAGGGADGTTFGLACGLMRAASDADEASSMAVDHTCETIGWFDTRSNAQFVFDCTVAVDAWPFAPSPASGLLTGVERSAAVWRELRNVIDDLSLVPSCPVDPSSTAGVSLTAAQWRVVALADGRRSINEVIELIGLGQLETCRELAGLIDEGLIELVGAGGHTAIDTLLHDVRAVDALAFGREALAHDEPSPEASFPAGADAEGIVAIADTGSAPLPVPSQGDAHPVHNPRAAGDADSGAASAQTTSADVPSEVNVGLYNRLIDGARRR